VDDLQAAEAVGKLQAAYPQVDFTGETGGVYAEVLMAYEEPDAAAGIQSLIISETWPSVAALVQHIGEARESRQYDERYPALPSPEAFQELAPNDETRAALRRYFEKVGVQEESRARMQHVVASGDKDARIEAGRLVAQAQILAEAGEGEGMDGIERSSRPSGAPSPFPSVSACGAEWGTRAVLIGGVKCCPVCRSPVSEGCTVKVTA
jgi:hypothetical protein